MVKVEEPESSNEGEHFEWDKEEQSAVRHAKRQKAKNARLNRIQKFLKFYSKFSHLTRTLLYILTGAIFILLPGFLLLWVDTQRTSFTKKDPNFPNGRTFDGKNMTERSNIFTDYDTPWSIDKAPVFLWFFYLFFCWALFFGTRFVMLVLPKLIIFVIETILGGESGFIRHYIDYINRVRAYASLTISFGVQYVIFAFVVFPYDYWQERTGNNWAKIISQILLSTVAVSGVLLGEKLVLQYIAVSPLLSLSISKHGLSIHQG
jgi:hypothetical protein